MLVKLGLYRGHFPHGTVGALYLFDEFLSFTIELPWVRNQRNISAIPDGVYELKMRYSAKFKWHLQLDDVPNRSWILMHPANDASTELEGCIAPVSSLVDIARGYSSRKALEHILGKLRPYFMAKHRVELEVRSSHFEDHILQQKQMRHDN
ncbi:DUF5675 family protein [Psychroflexus sp. ALD_RP9]|uniref:DUF5675 family protein n=1 Tax=Psychroflexus sp. ALD_RP9 TaxID=2777186 RepID=UPI001A905897|nr:DUF5675 family protein [Psychroflexus sp. ALD_RP9]QSS96348.1 hypothetical protein IMZ30_07720 [Psychroflexus sp. ALD_RP9]